jgi:hypothetical protein
MLSAPLAPNRLHHEIADVDDDAPNKKSASDEAGFEGSCKFSFLCLWHVRFLDEQVTFWPRAADRLLDCRRSAVTHCAVESTRGLQIRGKRGCAF